MTSPIPSHHYPIIIIRQRCRPPEEHPPDPFEGHLGPSLTRLGTITRTVRHTRFCCSTLRNDLCPCCNYCSEYPGVELEVLAVSWPELVLKREAEKCRLLVPFVPVRGLVPEWHERHWMLGSVYRGCVGSLDRGTRGRRRGFTLLSFLTSSIWILSSIFLMSSLGHPSLGLSYKC